MLLFTKYISIDRGEVIITEVNFVQEPESVNLCYSTQGLGNIKDSVGLNFLKLDFEIEVFP